MSTLIGYARVQATISYVCEAFGVSKAQLLSRDRHERVAWPRQVAMAISYVASDMPIMEIGRMFNRHHADVLYAVRQVHNRMDAYPKTDGALVRELQNKVAHERFG